MSAGKGKRGDIKEVAVERYFVERVEQAGGMCEKFTSPGRRGVPDRIVTWPAYGFARIHFVELKTVGGKLDSAQERDHARRRRYGAHVFVIWTLAQVDAYVERFMFGGSGCPDPRDFKKDWSNTDRLCPACGEVCEGNTGKDKCTLPKGHKGGHWFPNMWSDM